MALVWMARPSASMRCCASSSFPVWTPEMSRFCQTVRRDRRRRARARSRQVVHLRDRHPPDRHDDADPVSPSCFWARTPICAIRSKAGRAPKRRAWRDRICGRACLRAGDEFLDAHGIEHVFEPRLGAIGAVAMLDEEPDHGIGDFASVLRLHQHAGIAGEIMMPGDAAEAELETDAGRRARSPRSPAPPGSRYRWCLPAPRWCRRRRRRR